jgi:cyclophilin family peptidyl-prolyl cis-trans isomerase
MKMCRVLPLALVALLLGGCPVGNPVMVEGNPKVRLTTSQGDIVLELDKDAAPMSVDNFLQYVNEGFYDGTLFHRVIPGFVIQGGGYLPGLEEKAVTHDPIMNESMNGLANVRGSVAMARTDAPNSATSQFYINLADNASLDATFTQMGYAVFGTVVEGMDVVDKIVQVATEERNEMADVPVEDVVIQTAKVEGSTQTVDPEWDDYFRGLEYDLKSTGRDIIVQVLQGFIAGG